MKSLTAPIGQNRTFQIVSKEELIPAVRTSIREILALVGALTVASVIISFAIWAAGLELTNILAAGTWGVAFLFLGLAVETREPVAFLQLATGLILMTLAWLQSNLSSDFLPVSGVLVATWVAVAVFRALR